MNTISALLKEHAPDGVPRRPLRDVGTWYGGGTPSKAVAEFWKHGTVPWLSPKDMDVETVESTGLSVANAALLKSPLKLVPAGSVTFVVRSNVLRRRLPIAFVPFPTTLNQDMRAVVPDDGILPEYLLHFCRSRSEDILAVSGRTDGSMAAISSSAFLNYQVPIPPLPVQEAVVRLVTNLAALHSNLEVELEAEMKARRKQYVHYRDALLTFAETDTPPTDSDGH